MDKFDYKNSGNELFTVETIEEDVPVTCLGKEFKNDKERKEYFLGLLAEKLKNPEFRKIEGFPIGSDEDILALSDPPYYCACPNPWLNDFIKEWESQKPDKPANWIYKREPFASDVSEGKNDPIYNAHTYHTKVPHKAIMRYILHYTDPGDIVLDCFCGTGMTGIAAQKCDDTNTLAEIGMSINADGTLTQVDSSAIYNKGVRHAILNDLSPIASFIAYNYNSSQNIESFRKESEFILKELERKCGWMYKTLSPEGDEGTINFTVWSDVFICPHCGTEVVFYDAAVNEETGKVADTFLCPHCKAQLTKKILERAYETDFDPALGENTSIAKTVPVLIDYSVGKKRYQKKPDSNDFSILNKIQSMQIGSWYPADRMPVGKESRRNDKIGITNTHQFYTKRNLITLSTFRGLIKSPLSLFWFNSLEHGLSKRVKFGHFSFPMSTLSGTLYIPSVSRENSPLYFYSTRRDKLVKIFEDFKCKYNAIETCSSTKLDLEDNSIDYCFIDPPFGANLMYSELSFAWESWLRVKTDNKEEAIENSAQNKGVLQYKELMLNCFKEVYRVLKPGRWVTVEFSNTNQAVWNAIQTSLNESGFIVANVSALDKQIGSFKAVTTSSAVKQDLVISLYKPDESFALQISDSNGISGVWNFIRKHLEYLPVVKEIGVEHKGYLTVPDRDPRILYDRLVSYYVGHNILLPISSPDFIAELDKHFVERDGLYYLPEQVAQYDRMKALNKIGNEDITGSLFVHDESSAIAWIREQLKKKTMTTGEMTPLFMQELNSWDKNEKRLELAEILEENFLRYDGNGDVPSPIHSYLSTNYKELRNMDKDNPALMAKAKGRWYVPDPNKQADLEKLREKGLLKEFNGYLQLKGKLKEFRLEAVRAGFKKAWGDKDYKLILDFASRIPSNIVEEDPKLLMWYNGALTRSEK